MSDNVPNVEASPAVAMIVAERRRQLGEKGYSLEHDRDHDYDELARAAAWYALPARMRAGVPIALGPEGSLGFVNVDVAAIVKPRDFVLHASTDRLRDLAKAGALIVAEIERLTLEPR